LKIHRIHIFFTVVIFAFSYCRNKETEIHSQYSESSIPSVLSCETDSALVIYFLEKTSRQNALDENICAFYANRKYAPAWINSLGLNENAGKFINLLNNEKKAEGISKSSNLLHLQNLFNEMNLDAGRFYCSDSLSMEVEVLLTRNFFEFAWRNWHGADDDILKQVNWFIVRKQFNYEQLLSDYLSSKQKSLLEEPVYKQYARLKEHLQKYYAMELKGGWPILPEKDTSLKIGDSSEVIPLVKQQLYLMDDLPLNDGNKIFNENLVRAVKGFQKRHGLVEDGIISRKTFQALRVTIHDRIYQILTNMERCRWVPTEVVGDYLVVNIPDFRLYVYQNSKIAWSCNVIVGKSNALNNTVIFNDSVEFIVFNPYWNIPKNILSKETLPAIKNNLEYLQKNNLEVVDNKGRNIEPSSIEWNNYTNHFPYIIRQKPGRDNSLGLVKFLFPNPYDIYIHDTPAKSLFSESNRSFSHGCVRVEEPFKLVQFLLREDSTWSQAKIDATLSNGEETFIKLKKKVPVFITYFTCWVNRDGKLNFRDDVYGHDTKMKKLLFVN